MPTYLPTRPSEGTGAGRILASVAIILALVFLIELTLETPPQANELGPGALETTQS